MRSVDQVSVNKQSTAAAERSHNVQSSSDVVASQPVMHHIAYGNAAAVPPAGNSGVRFPPHTADVHQPTVTSAAAAAGGGGDTDVVMVAFPLAELFDPHIACLVCFTDGRPPAMSEHDCQQDVLIVQSKQNGAWFRIRERINHLEFAGKYHMCNQHPNPAIGRRCPRGDHCTFAHSEVERFLWMAEKSGQFNIRQYVSQLGSRSGVAARHTVQSLLANHPGQLAFLCSECYLYNRRVSMQSPAKPSLCSIETHDWSSSAVLAHCSLAAGNITLISPYPVTGNQMDFALCLMSVFCPCRWKGECTHAHSVVERDLWYVQRDCGLTQQQIVQQVSFTSL